MLKKQLNKLVALAAPAPLDVWSDEFATLCAQRGVALREVTAEEAEKSEAAAAEFAIGVLRRSRSSRWRFPDALSGGEKGRFCRWLGGRGAKRLGLSGAALKKIRGAFRRPPGARVVDIYLQDRELHRLYPLGLVPVGQRHFFEWLTTHGRDDQNVRDHEILWFLHAAAERPASGLWLSYLVQPEWQTRFPDLIKRALPAGGSAGVNMLSHFCYPSGIQQAGLWAKAALESAGLRTSCRDVPAGIGSDLLPRRDWLGLEVYPITISNVAPVPYFATEYERAGLARREGVYRIAYWAWELERIPAEWTELAPLVDEIWAPTEFVAAAFRSGFPRPVYTMPPGVEVGEIEPVTKRSLGIPDDHYVFLFTFDMFSDVMRKNPFAVMRAFRLAFSRHEKATLLLKTGSGSPDPGETKRLEAIAREEGALLLRETVSRARAYGIIAMCDCYVSLHRSEGFGLGMAEAMLLGKPTIATRYSGNVDFMNDDNSLLVDYTLVSTRNSGPLYTGESVWAEPSITHAARSMRRVFDHRAEAQAMGARAQADLTKRLSLRAAGERMRERLREIATPPP